MSVTRGRSLPAFMQLVAVALAFSVAAGCAWGAGDPNKAKSKTGGKPMLTSTAFANGKPIPKKHTGEGPNVSPPLAWSGLPEGTKEIAVICVDPDGGDWVHWTIYGIPATVTQLKEGVARTAKPADPKDALQGNTSFGKIGYGGPMPPKGSGVHHYHFTLYALDAPLGLKPGIEKDALDAAMKGHILAEVEIVGTYERR